jgi:hypothetical protein
VYVVVLAKSQKKSDLRIADLASSEEDRKKVCGLPEAVLRIGYPRWEYCGVQEGESTTKEMRKDEEADTQLDLAQFESGLVNANL